LITQLEDVLKEAKRFAPKRLAVAAADDLGVLMALRECQEAGCAGGLLVGDEKKVRALAEEAGLDLRANEVFDEPDDLKAAAKAVELVREGKADIVMKGYIHTDDFLRAVLDKERGLRTGLVMSHVFLLGLAEEKRLILVTDCAMNIAPDLVQKAQIILNAVYLAQLFGYSQPKVAVLAAVELVNPNMPATMEAAILAKMSERGQFPACDIDGPLALDNAISLAAAKHKKIGGTVAGTADILVVPDIEAGNILFKSFVYLAKGSVAGVVVGASAPIVLTSRSDSAESKKLSIAAAILMADLQRKSRLKIGKVHY
jgi:phosphate butyryltransferase